jgi:hypothetical protein
MRLTECDYRDLEPLQAAAKKSAVLTYERKGARYWLIQDGAVTVGYCGLLPVGRDKVRLISCFVLSAYRGKGYGTFATEERMRIAKEEYRASFIQVQTVNPPFFSALGFSVSKVFKCCTGMLLVCR